jgi:hypothetical protein
VQFGFVESPLKYTFDAFRIAVNTFSSLSLKAPRDPICFNSSNVGSSKSLKY